MLVVGHEERGDTHLALNSTNLLAQVVADLGIERRQGLVEQEDAGLTGQGTRQGDSLTLTARHLVGVLVGMLGQAGDRQEPVDRLLAFGRARLAELERELDVGTPGHVGKEAVLLKHHAEVALRGGDRRDVLTADQHGAGIRLLEPGQDAQRRGLAAATGPEQADQLPRLDLEGEVAEGHRGTEFLADARHQDGRHHTPAA